jgi:sugar O-acyltransferase (sialic acid O-acetyltransferase NeuD family)
MIKNKNSGVLIGYSGHGYVVAEAAIHAGINLIYYIDLKTIIQNPFNLEYLASDINLQFNGWNKSYEFIIGIGNNIIRENIGKSLLSRNQLIPTVIHPGASISDKIQFGLGVFIARGASVNPLAVIGNYSIINTSAVVEHECVIGSAAHIAPGAILAGNVTVGNRTFIGANSVVKQGVKIGNDVIIGAGSVIIRDVPDGITLVGNPAKKL